MAIETSFIIAFILTTTFINFSINSKLGFIFCLVSFIEFTFISGLHRYCAVLRRMGSPFSFLYLGNQFKKLQSLR